MYPEVSNRNEAAVLTYEQLCQTGVMNYCSGRQTYDKNTKRWIRHEAPYEWTQLECGVKIRMDDWYRLMREAIKDKGLDLLLLDVKRHVKKNCAWLKNDDEIEKYSMTCMAHKAYEYWEKSKSKIFVFYF